MDATRQALDNLVNAIYAEHPEKIPFGLRGAVEDALAVLDGRKPERSAQDGAAEPSGRTVIKTVVQTTVLHYADQTVDGVPLAVIGHEIDEGDWLGASRVVLSVPVPPEQLEAEQLALGNDGTFFEVDEEEPESAAGADMPAQAPRS